jgi:hypothetical protein
MRSLVWAIGGACALALAPGSSGAEVFQCVDASGKVLLTDSGCPPGYRVNLVVGEPRSAQDDLAYSEDAQQRALDAEARNRAAEAEAERLRAQLDAERRRDLDQQDRLEALDRKLDALLDRPEVYGGTAVVPVPALPLCGPNGRPWVDCRPPRERPKVQVHRPGENGARDPYCGIAGCTPGITHAPWDDERRAQPPR